MSFISLNPFVVGTNVSNDKQLLLKSSFNSAFWKHHLVTKFISRITLSFNIRISNPFVGLLKLPKLYENASIGNPRDNAFVAYYVAL